jgi:hypothetical protein
MAATAFPIPVSNGIVDPLHRKKIGSAIWLFLLFIDWTTDEQNGVGRVHGGKPVKVKELMERLDLQERQVRDQLQRLKDGGYIRLNRTPYGYSIDVLKSKKWVFRDRQKTAALSNSDRQESADLFIETGNNPPKRPAENCRCNILDITEETNKIAREPKKASRTVTHKSEQVSGFKQTIAIYHDCFVSKFGAKPDIDSRDGKLLSGLLAAHGAAEVQELLRVFFEHPPAWVQKGCKFTIPAFKSSYTEILAQSRNGKAQQGGFVG